MDSLHVAFDRFWNAVRRQCDLLTEEGGIGVTYQTPGAIRVMNAQNIICSFLNGPFVTYEDAQRFQKRYGVLYPGMLMTGALFEMDAEGATHRSAEPHNLHRPFMRPPSENKRLKDGQYGQILTVLMQASKCHCVEIVFNRQRPSTFQCRDLVAQCWWQKTSALRLLYQKRCLVLLLRLPQSKLGPIQHLF